MRVGEHPSGGDHDARAEPTAPAQTDDGRPDLLVCPLDRLLKLLQNSHQFSTSSKTYLRIASYYTQMPLLYASAMAERESSPLEEAVRRVGDRWTLLVIEALLDGPRRFNELSAEVPGIAPNILTARLRSLERDALVVTNVYSERPRRFSYELSESGRELAGALRLLADWGSRRSENADPHYHEPCGTALEARWYCPTCDRTVDEGEAADVHYA